MEGRLSLAKKNAELEEDEEEGAEREEWSSVELSLAKEEDGMKEDTEGGRGSSLEISLAAE